jgi:hypothetical protein
MSDDNPIDRAFNMAPMDNSRNQISTIVAAAKNDSATEDFKFSRANIREVIENGNDAIAKLAVIADQSQNPRAFEVLAKLMDTVVSASKELLEVQEKIRSIDKADVPQDAEARNNITNNLFVGSTSELQKILSDLKNNQPS